MLRKGTILVDETDSDTELKLLIYLEHSIQDARTSRDQNRFTAYKQIQFVKMNLNCDVTFAGYAPYLDYRPMNDSEKATIKTQLSRSFNMEKIESQAINYAVNNLVPVHFKDIKTKRELLVDKISEAVKNRLRIEITYWNNRFEQLNKWSYG